MNAYKYTVLCVVVMRVVSPEFLSVSALTSPVSTLTQGGEGELWPAAGHKHFFVPEGLIDLMPT